MMSREIVIACSVSAKSRIEFRYGLLRLRKARKSIASTITCVMPASNLLTEKSCCGCS